MVSTAIIIRDKNGQLTPLLIVVQPRPGNHLPKETKSAIGFPDKGMPPWGPIIGDTKSRHVTAFVRSIRNKNVQGKEPQGNPVD